MADTGATEQPSYIDYVTFLAPEFSPESFANTLVLSTNDPNDAPLDLSTPLSKVLFDIQEIDSHIDILTARSAVPLLSHTKDQTLASRCTLGELDPQIQTLNSSYKQLEKQVIRKHAEADEVRQVALRLWDTLRLGRSVGRCLQLGRQLEVQYAELAGAGAGSESQKKADHRALVRIAYTVLGLREILQQGAAGEEGHGLNKVAAIRSLQDGVVAPIEKSIRETSDHIVREFSLGSSANLLTFVQSKEAKAKTVSALLTLYLLSPSALGKGENWAPTLMLQALESHLRAALQSSISALARSLASLPSLERTLGEVSARCQNLVALELVLDSTKAPEHPLRALLSLPAQAAVETNSGSGTLLQPLLAKLETGSLPSYFWRSLASSMSPRVQDIVIRGGVAARTLRSNRNSVSDAIHECVVRGVQLPSALLTKGRGKSGSSGRGWEREIAVMVGSITGHLGR